MYQEASELLGKALELDSDNAIVIENLKFAYYKCGVAYYDKAEPERAADWFRKFLLLDPSCKEARQALASTYATIGSNWIDNGECKRGVEEYKKALELNPDDSILVEGLKTAYCKLGIEAYNSNKYEEAIGLLLHGLKLDPRDGQILYLLGDTHERLADFNQARFYYHKVLRSISEDSSLYLQAHQLMDRLIPQVYLLTHNITVSNHGGEVSNLELEVVLPHQDISHQEVSLLSCIHTYTLSEVGGVKKVVMSFPSLKPEERKEIKFTYRIETEAVYRDPELYLGGPIDFSTSQYETYLGPDTLIETDAWQLRTKAEELTRERVAFYDKVKSIYDFVVDYLKYEKLSQNKGALWAYLNRKGNCSEFSTLFVTLCRISGIPARIVEGYLWGTPVDIDKGHAWAEVCSPSIGQWLPVDPVGGKLSPFEYFGGITSDYIVFPGEVRSKYRSALLSIGEQITVDQRVQVEKMHNY